MHILFKCVYFISVDCKCNEYGAKKLECDKSSGMCDCKDKFTGIKCSDCIDELYGFPACTGKIIIIYLYLTSTIVANGFLFAFFQ